LGGARLTVGFSFSPQVRPADLPNAPWIAFLPAKHSEIYRFLAQSDDNPLLPEDLTTM